jgi:hypothetical protein
LANPVDWGYECLLHPEESWKMHVEKSWDSQVALVKLQWVEKACDWARTGQESFLQMELGHLLQARRSRILERRIVCITQRWSSSAKWATGKRGVWSQVWKFSENLSCFHITDLLLCQQPSCLAVQCLFITTPWSQVHIPCVSPTSCLLPEGCPPFQPNLPQPLKVFQKLYSRGWGKRIENPRQVWTTQWDPVGWGEVMHA